MTGILAKASLVRVAPLEKSMSGSGLAGRKFTCFDGFEDALIGQGAVYTPEGTVTDGQMITGKGAGWAVDFGLAILACLKGPDAAAKVRAGLML